MKHRYKSTLVVLALTLALGAVATSAALAVPVEWEAKTGGVFKPITSPLTIKGTSTSISIWNTFEVATTGEECSAEVEATIEPHGLGKVTKFNLTGCKRLGKCESVKGSGITGLPFKTELTLLESGAVRNLISEEGALTPGLEFQCVILGIIRNEKCKMPPWLHVVNSGSGVTEEFPAPTKCNEGLYAEWVGKISFTPPAGVEAIRVTP